MNTFIHSGACDGNREDYQKSLEKLLTWVDDTTEVYPGHGEVFRVGEWKMQVK